MGATIGMVKQEIYEQYLSSSQCRYQPEDQLLMTEEKWNLEDKYTLAELEFGDGDELFLRLRRAHHERVVRENALMDRLRQDPEFLGFPDDDLREMKQNSKTYLEWQPQPTRQSTHFQK